jgi:hypothetical protein
MRGDEGDLVDEAQTGPVKGSRVIAGRRRIIALPLGIVARRWDRTKDREGVEMKRLRVLLLVGLAALFIASVTGPALADPPPSNKNVNPFMFDCTRGSVTRHFVAIGIGQSAQLAGQIVGTSEVVMFVQVIAQGVLVFDIPGLSSSDALWTCTIEEVPDLVVEVLITPRA